MISNQEDVFVAVRVQDPRMQNEGSWNSYVDYKIFLHTNSKAFTAKTSCVRRRYSEFAWLKKKLQKNAGLVPVPELPGKYYFFFSNEDFLERRRKGLQAFLDNVVNMTVCLSDSQLHLFLQTQLPVGHIQDCVQGHTPYSVTDAILTYASSNRGYAQAQEEDSIKEPSLTVSYESMESPAPHQPKDLFNPELLSCDDGALPEICDEDAVERQREENSSVRVVQKNDHLEAVVEDCGPAEVTFFLGDGQDALESLGLAEPPQQQRSQTRIQTPVEVHSPMGAGLFEEVCSVREEGVTASDTEGETGPHPDAEEEKEEDDDPRESSAEAKTGNVDSEPENCANSAAVSGFKGRDFEEQGTESDTTSQEEVLDGVRSEQQVLETHAASEVNGLERVDAAEEPGCPEEFKNPDGQSESKAETPLQLEIHEETGDVLGVPEVEGSGGDLAQQMDRADPDSGADGHSSSNESIVRVSDDESICDEDEDSVQDSVQESQDSIQESRDLIQDSFQSASGDAKPVGCLSPAEASGRNILDLHTNGRSLEEDDVSAPEDEDQHNSTGGGGDDSGKPLEVTLTVTGKALTENGAFRILESSCTAAGERTEQEDVAPEETHEVEAR